MKRLWTGNTARQEAVQFATVRYWLSPRDAVHSVEEDCVNLCWVREPVGSIRRAISEYFDNLSESAWQRLVRDVARARTGR
jgi:hypothetical protein